MNETNQTREWMAHRKKCCHACHLVMTICTLGIWLLIWIAFALHVSQHNKEVDAFMAAGKSPGEYKEASRFDWAGLVAGLIVVVLFFVIMLSLN